MKALRQLRTQLPNLLQNSLRASLSTGPRRIAVATVAGLALAGTLWAVYQPSPQPKQEIAAMLPQGALLTLESKDFSAVLKQWDSSPQKAAWVKSDNYAVFSNSRLFGRLGDAQKEFAQAAGLPADKIGSDFLTSVAGTESVFGWYDIGKLEFLYITRLSPGAAAQNPLMQVRDRFATRQAAGQTFYVRTTVDATQGQESQAGELRTVAFATHGDWLLLSTREDLMAGALSLMAANHGSVTSVAAEPWFAEAHAASAAAPGALRMTLNLEKIVPSPYFRSYWIQRNITAMKQYRSAVADLFTDSGSFREERVLLPKAAPDAGTQPNLAPLLALVPQHIAVYRAQAAPSVEAALASLNEKLLQRSPAGYSDPALAPVADLQVQEPGSATDLETRIDTPPPATPAKGAELAPLRQQLTASSLDAMLTLSRTGPPADGIWVPFQSAVVLSATQDWDAAAIEGPLQQALGARLTASSLGLEWKPVKAKGGSYFEIGEARPLELAVRGKLLILADDPALMQELLDHAANGGNDRKPSGQSKLKSETGPAGTASLIAVLDLTDAAGKQERANFARWSALVDRADPATSVGSDPNQGVPSFFSRNIRSLSDTFANLAGERMVERRDGALIRQTVTYTWQP